MNAKAFMKCPTCTDPDLVMTERQGVEIDYCPKCRGVWLDRGELDKIIERFVPSGAALPTAASPQATPPGYAYPPATRAAITAIMAITERNRGWARSLTNPTPPKHRSGTVPLTSGGRGVAAALCL